MKKLSILLVLFTISLGIQSQVSKIAGSWLMTKAETPNGTEEPYFITEYREDGIMVIMEMEVGTWKYDKKANAIVMESEMDKDFNGISKILKLEDNEMVVEKDGAKLFYSKFDITKINEVNAGSGLFGAWNVESDNPDVTLVFKFEEPDNFMALKAESGMEETIRGSWIYQPEEKSIIIIGFAPEYRGISLLKELTPDKLILDHNGELIIATKADDKNSTLERLNFKYDDFPEDEDVDDSKLPWQDFYGMADFLSSVDYLKYRRGVLLEEVNQLKYSPLLSYLTVDIEEPTVRFSNKYIDQADTSQYSENYKGGLSGMYDVFFPKTEIWPYRIIGEEMVSIPAGDFNCVVIEGMDGEEKVKYWMIIDMPGVYAKIIQEGEDVFGDMAYSITELEEISFK
jgi:hypothetical protein